MSMYKVQMQVDNGPWQDTGETSQYEGVAESRMWGLRYGWPAPGVDRLASNGMELRVGTHTINYRVTEA